MSSGQLIEKRPGHPAKSSRTESTTDTLGRASNMCNSTTPVKSASTGEQRPLGERVAEVITLEMGKQGISSNQLSEMTGISPEDIRLKLNDQWAMNLDDLYNISTALGWKVYEIIDAGQRRHTDTSIPAAGGDAQ